MNILQCSWAGKNTLTKKPWGIKVQATEKPHQRRFRWYSAQQIVSRDNLIPAARFYLYWPTGQMCLCEPKYQGGGVSPHLREC